MSDKIAKMESEFISKLENLTKPKYTENCIIIRGLIGGYQVVMFKNIGLHKGETVLATVCSGNLGKAMAVTAAKAAMDITMIDKLISEV